MTGQEFSRLAEAGPVILDGALGTNMYRAGMPRGVCTEKWIEQHPDRLLELQRGYVEAGTQILYAPTFSANRRRLAEFGLEDELVSLNRRLVELSREAAGGRAYVAGDLSPTGLMPESAGGSTPDEDILAIYQEQMQCLIDAGVDLLVCETMMSVDETVIALEAATSLSDLPVMCTMSVQADGQAYFGGSIFDGAEIFEAMGAAAVGVNCCSGPDQLESLIRGISGRVHIPVIAKPNAGLPQIDALGNAVYDMKPEAFGRHMKKLSEAGARLLGGCCGTDPSYIMQLVREIGRSCV